MINRLRLVLPPDFVLITVALLYAITELPYAFLEWKIQQRLELPRASLLMLRGVALAYGLWRVGSFHPAHQPDYGSWLERTPWTPRSPLPGGPIALSWADLLPLSALAILARLHGMTNVFITLDLFLIGYLVSLLASMWTTGCGPFGYAIAFGIGLAIRLWPDPRLSLVTLLATYALGLVGLRVSLAKFPWNVDRKTFLRVEVTKVQDKQCGWPFDQLQPNATTGPQLSRLDGFLISLLVGWFLYASESLITNPAERQVLVEVALGVVVAGSTIIRTLVYCDGYAPPISLWGRIRTGRWIIPGYDQVFVAPLCTLMVGVLALDPFRPPGLDDLIFLPIMTSLALLVALDTGPSLARWRLTGRHRITLSSSQRSRELVKIG